MAARPRTMNTTSNVRRGSSPSTWKQRPRAGLGCIVHQRSCVAGVLAHLRPWAGRVRVVFHCFGEGLSVAEQIINQGWLVSFTGIVTFKNAQSVRETIAAIPINRLMLETDCPFLAPVPFRGKRCEPAHVVETARTIAQVKNCTLEELSAVTWMTAQGFFTKLPPE